MILAFNDLRVVNYDHWQADRDYVISIVQGHSEKVKNGKFPAQQNWTNFYSIGNIRIIGLISPSQDLPFFFKFWPSKYGSGGLNFSKVLGRLCWLSKYIGIPRNRLRVLISAWLKIGSSKFKKKLKGIPIPMELILGTESRTVQKLVVFPLCSSMAIF